MANNPFVTPRQPGVPRQTGQGGNQPPAPPPYVDPAFTKGADGLYAGRNGTRTSLPQPFVDMLAPTGQQMPATFGQFIAPGSPLSHPVAPGTAPAPNPQPLGPGVAPLPPVARNPGKKKKKKAQAIL